MIVNNGNILHISFIGHLILPIHTTKLLGSNRAYKHVWTNKNVADNKIASLSYKPYACFRRDIKDLSYIIIWYKEVYLWLLSMIHVPLVCKLTGTACTRLPSTFTHTHKPKLFLLGMLVPPTTFAENTNSNV